MKSIENIYSLKIAGLNIHHILTYFENEHFEIYNVKRIDSHNLELEIKSKDLKKFKKTPLYKQYKITSRLASGYLVYLSKIVQNLGLILGVITALILSFNLTSSVLSVDIVTSPHTCENGDFCIFKEDNLKDVKNTLAELGVKMYSSLKSLPTNSVVEKELMKKYKQISGVKMSVNGVHVKIEIIEAKLPSSETSSSLIAEASGVVISTFVSSGNLKVKNGDMVLKGDVLVEPENDIPVRASIVIRTFYHEATIYEENQITYQRTGKKVTKNGMSLFGHDAVSSECGYSLYETEVSSRYVFYNLFLPLKVVSVTYWELEKQENTIPFSQKEQEIKDNLKQTTRELLPSNAEEKNATFTTFSEGSRTRIDCYIEAYLTIEK